MCNRLNINHMLRLNWSIALCFKAQRAETELNIRVFIMHNVVTKVENGAWLFKSNRKDKHSWLDMEKIVSAGYRRMIDGSCNYYITALSQEPKWL